jgi:copper chaperone
MTTQTFRIEDLHCPACVMRLESLEDCLPGIIKVEGSYRKQELVVEYDEALVDEARILAAIRELGYTPTI